jgi:CRISP-associated protein Cas1
VLEPGTRISHAAVKLAAVTGTLLIWVGEAGVRVYLRANRAGRGRISSFARQSCPG